MEEEEKQKFIDSFPIPMVREALETNKHLIDKITVPLDDITHCYASRRKGVVSFIFTLKNNSEITIE